ncbi:MAG: hypothetical protein WA982_11180 [Rubrobacteraceae bacterium]
MKSEVDSESRRKRLRIALSIGVVLFGLLMMASTLTSYGPTLLIGFVFGGGFVFYGTLRAYRALRS